MGIVAQHVADLVHPNDAAGHLTVTQLVEQVEHRVDLHPRSRRPKFDGRSLMMAVFMPTTSPLMFSSRPAGVAGS